MTIKPIILVIAVIAVIASFGAMLVGPLVGAPMERTGRTSLTTPTIVQAALHPYSELATLAKSVEEGGHIKAGVDTIITLEDGVRVRVEGSLTITRLYSQTPAN